MDDPAAADHAVLIVGEPGIGKSVLLDAAARRARDAGATVLFACGTEAEADVAFAGLHQVLQPVLDSAVALPDRLRTSLLGAFGLVDAAPEPLFLGLAAFVLLTTINAQPVVILLDDTHWLDRSSLEVLGFVARRQAGERLAVVAASRRDAIPAGLDDFMTMSLQPLDRIDVDRLLDLQPRPLSGEPRVRVIDQSGGNPLALVELSKVASDGLLSSDRFVEMLPLTHRLQKLYAGALEGLPAESRTLLLLAAMAAPDELRTALGPPEPGAWNAAEQANLIDVDGTAVRFRHPLIRSAVYHAAPANERRAAHRLLAGRLEDAPDRRARHLAAAAEGPDEDIAAALEATADRAVERGAFSSAARMLERAADLSPNSADGARRLGLAADVASNAGQPAWVLELARRAVALGGDPAVIALARYRTAYVEIYTARHDAAFDALLSLAEDLLVDDPATTLAALVTASNIAFNTASVQQRRALMRLLDQTGKSSPTSTALPAAWVLAATDPFEHRDAVYAHLNRLIERRRVGERDEFVPWEPFATAGVRDLPRLDPVQLSIIGAAAWAVDEPQLTVATLSEVLAAMRARGVVGPNVGVLVTAGWACVDLGRWAEAVELIAESMVVAEAAELDTMAMQGRSLEATVAALRGDHVAARDTAAATLAKATAHGNLAVVVRCRLACTLAATAVGEHDVAWTNVRSCFTADGEPVHFHLSYLGLGDLAAAATRTDNVDDASQIVERAVQFLDGKCSERMVQLLHRASALLAGANPLAENHFCAGLATASQQWPFDRAQIELDFGEWLRRQRRAREARPFLASALDAFTLLGSEPWANRAAAELRAAGVGTESAAATGFATLTAQEKEIVRLAAEGLTNREIGARLFLAPRTIGSHLYHVFPKLNITSRSQLRDVIERESATAGSDADD